MMQTISILLLIYKKKLPITSIMDPILRILDLLRLSAAVTPKKSPMNDPIDCALR